MDNSVFGMALRRIVPSSYTLYKWSGFPDHASPVLTVHISLSCAALHLCHRLQMERQPLNHSNPAIVISNSMK